MRALLSQRYDRRRLVGAAAVAAAGFVRRGQAAESPPGAAAARPRFLLEWGSHGKGPGQFDSPIGLAIDARDHVYVTDFKNERVQVFRSDGGFVHSFRVQVQPGGIAVDGDGRVYVAHWNQDKIAVYSQEGRQLFEWGRRGSEPGALWLPGGLAVSPDGSLYACDQANGRIQKFTRDGRFVHEWGSHGSGPGQFGGARARGSRFAGPQFVAVGPTGTVFATDAATGRVQAFTPDGAFLTAWGDNAVKPGSFGRPEGPQIQGPIALCVDRAGRVWVSATNHLVQQFTPEGRFLGALGGDGKATGQFHYPHGLAVDSRGDFYVVDAGNQRIQKFALE